MMFIFAQYKSYVNLQLEIYDMYNHKRYTKLCRNVENENTYMYNLQK